MVNIWLSVAAFSGFLSVALGAFGAHGLKEILDTYGSAIFGTAVQYQMFHTLGLLAIGVLQVSYPQRSFRLCGWCFILGIILFSGSLYIMALSEMSWLGIITPIGGTAFLIGWGALVYQVRGLRVRLVKHY